jgi:isoleucyl-tRNA synthetase
MSHGIVLGSDGQKMSKSLRNYPDVSEVFDRDGADAMRWFLMSSPILRGGNLVVTEQGIRDGVRQVLLPLWSAWSFFALYANASSYDAKWSTGSTDLLDRYLLATTHDLVADVQRRLDAYDVAGACQSVREYLETLTNWYVRRSRQRFWDGESATGSEAFDTLYTCLEVVTRTAAPLLPLVTEEIWRGLTGGRSVHLTDWPDPSDLPADPALVSGMDRAREVCSVALGLRKARNLRVRLPLLSLTVASPDAAALEPYADLVADEVNVREVRLVSVEEAGSAAAGVSQRLTVNARAAGPRLGRSVQQAIAGSKNGDWSISADGAVTSGGIELQDGEFTVETVVADASASQQATGVLTGGGFVLLDTTLTPELEAEGLARDVVRAVQQARRDAGLDISDRIRLTVAADEAVWAAVVAHQGTVMAETLAVQFGSAGTLDALALGDGVMETLVGDGLPLRVKVERFVG